MIIKKIVETVKISKSTKALQKERDWAIEAMQVYEAVGLMNLRHMMLTGCVFTDNEIASNHQQIREIWGIDF